MATTPKIGLCQCGCGQPTKPAPRNNSKWGWAKGRPVRFIIGHHRRSSGVAYIVDSKTGCWNWQLTQKSNGYGGATVNGKTVRAHRAYYEQAKGPILKDFDLHHKCKNRLCVNPEHLEPISHLANTRLSDATKLNHDKAKEIRGLRRAGEAVSIIAKKFGISKSNVWMVLNNKTWKEA